MITNSMTLNRLSQTISRMVSVVALSAASVLVAPAMAACQASVVEPLQKVGETRLRVYFFKVYDATLYTDSGSYPDAQEVALNLDYLRDISAEQLVDTTRDEWQSLGYEVGEREEDWLTQLQDMWPDVQEGDCLLAHKTDDGDQTALSFYNADGQLGAIEGGDFAERFLAIWLSENSSFKRNRDQLVGQ